MAGLITLEMRKAAMGQLTNYGAANDYWLRLYTDASISDGTKISDLTECIFDGYAFVHDTWVNAPSVDVDGSVYRLTKEVVFTYGGPDGSGEVVKGYVLFADAAGTRPLVAEWFTTPYDLTNNGASFVLLPVAYRDKQGT